MCDPVAVHRPACALCYSIHYNLMIFILSLLADVVAAGAQFKLLDFKVPDSATGIGLFPPTGIGITLGGGGVTIVSFLSISSFDRLIFSKTFRIRS